jgi:hypothetical protein
MSPVKKAPGAGEQTGRKLITLVAYRTLALLQVPLGSLFWLVEQHKGRLFDQIQNERSGGQ